jgi:hypothetical protein
VNGVVLGDNAFSQQAAVGQNGFRMPDVIANLRVDQAWGFAGVSVAVHDASGAYYQTPNNVNNGHPADKLGWAVAVGGLLNLPGGDRAGVNFAYSEGAAGYATNIGNGMQLYNASTSVGVGWLTDGVFDTGTEVQLTRVWSINAGYQHIWNPKWKTSWFGGYVNVSYNDTAKNIINSHLPGAAGTIPCGVPVAGAVFPPITIVAGNGNACSPNFSFFEVGSRTQWNPVPQLDIGLEVLYTHLNTAYKGAGIYPNAGTNGSRPPVAVIDDQNIWSAMFRWQRNFYP